MRCVFRPVYDARTNGSYRSRFRSYRPMNSPILSVIVCEGSCQINL